MADSSLDTNVSALTRLVRAGALIAAQGASVGFAANTFRHWNRLPDFVATNKMSTAERGHVLGWLVLPALVWVALVLVGVTLRPRIGHRLSSLERLGRRGSWIVALGLLPVLLHPTLWRTRTLMFLLATGVITLVAWWAIRLTQAAAHRWCAPSVPSDFERIVNYVEMATPAKLKVVLPLLLVGIGVLYVILRGVWLDPTAVPRFYGDPPVSVHSWRQGFLVLGHGGWLGIPVAALKFLRPPGHAHIFFWVSCVASAAFPLYAWTKSHLGGRVALVVAFCYLSMPALRTIGRAEVVPLGIAAGLFFFSILLWERRKFESAFVMTLLTVGVHEQAALWFCCFGVYFTGFAATRTLGRWLTISAGIYFLLMAGLFLPHLDLDPYHDAFKGLWGTRAVGLVETLRVALTNPGYVLTRWLDLQGLLFWLVMFVPFAFLPVVGRNWLLWVMPGVVFAVVAPGRAPGLPVTAGAAVHFVVLGFAASITTLARLHTKASTRHHANAAVVAWIFALIPCIYQLGALWLPAL